MVHGGQAKPTYSAVFRTVFKKTSGVQNIHKIQLSISKNELINTGWIVDSCLLGSVENHPLSQQQTTEEYCHWKQHTTIAY